MASVWTVKRPHLRAHSLRHRRDRRSLADQKAVAWWMTGIGHKQLPGKDT